MKATILDGSQTNDLTGERVRTALMAQLEVSGWEVERVIIRDQKSATARAIFSAGFAALAYVTSMTTIGVSLRP